MKFLTESIQLSNKLASFKSTIHLHSVVTLQCIPQMLDTGNPWKRISIEKHWRDLPDWILGEDDSFSLGFIWINVGTKLKILFLGKLFTCLNHFLQP